jgi:hypothetical protein
LNSFFIQIANPVNYGTNGASVALNVSQQTEPKFRFKLECTNPSTATNGYAERQFVAYPDYSFKYGAIATVEIGVV